MKRIPLEDIFSKYELTYLQGTVFGLELNRLNSETKGNTRRVQRRLTRWFNTYGDKDIVPMPWMLLMLSPFHKAIILQGKEVFEMLNLFKPLKLKHPLLKEEVDVNSFPIVKPTHWNVISEDIIRMACGKPPQIQRFIKDGFWDEKKGPTDKFKRRLHLQKNKNFLRFV